LFSDAGNDPTTLTTRRAYDPMTEGFGAGLQAARSSSSPTEATSKR
jgi:hypothetical protein